MALTALRSRSVWERVLACLAALALAASLTSPAVAQRSNQDEEEDNSNRAFTPDVGEIVMGAQEMLSVENYRGALGELNRAMTEEEPTPYELGVILFMSGNAKYNLDDVNGALADWERALREGDLKLADRLNLMSMTGQLYLIREDYRTAVNILEEFISLGGEANDQIHRNLAIAYLQLGDRQNTLRHARSAFDKGNPKQRWHYDLLNSIYMEFNMPVERLALLEEMVGVFPQEKPIWRQIAALHHEAGRARRAFEINKIMYLNGMMTEEDEIMQVVDYYSYYDVPYRGARILEAEINAGRIERTQENLEKLGRFYRQANEFERAIPPLEAAARLAPDGESFQSLGESYYAEARYEEADSAFQRAIDRGGLETPGEIWHLIGVSRVEREMYEEAIEAFEQAERYQGQRQIARAWSDVAQRAIDTARNSAWFEIEVLMGERRVTCERLLSDMVLYRARVESGEYTGPDCIALVNDDDYTTAPDVVGLAEAYCQEFESVPSDFTGKPQCSAFTTASDESGAAEEDAAGSDEEEGAEEASAEDASETEEASAAGANGQSVSAGE